jgi:hypothetical protein
MSLTAAEKDLAAIKFWNTNLQFSLLTNFNFKLNITVYYGIHVCCYSEPAKNLYLQAIRSFRSFLKVSEIQSRQDDRTKFIANILPGTGLINSGRQ